MAKRPGLPILETVVPLVLLTAAGVNVFDNLPIHARDGQAAGHAIIALGLALD